MRPHRILLVNGNFRDGTVGGTQTFTDQLATWLRECGHDVGVLCLGEREEMQDSEGISVFRVRPFQLPAARLTRVINQSLAIHNPMVATQIRRVIRRYRPDLCHIQMLRRITPVMWQILAQQRIPTIQTLHELYSLWNFNPFRREPPDIPHPTRSAFVDLCKRRHRLWSQSLRMVCAPSSYALEAYRGDGYFPRVPAEVIPNASPAEFGDPRLIAERRLARISDPPTIRFLYLARLELHKGVEVVLDAMARLEDADIRLTVAGEGSQESLVRQRASGDPRITFVGPVQGERRRRLFLESDALVCPSLWGETFGLVVTEAQAAALPCIVTDVGGLRERVIDGLTGIQIGTESAPDQLAQAMRLLTSSHRRSSMILAAAERARSYGPREFLDLQLRAYTRVMSTHAQGRANVSRDWLPPTETAQRSAQPS